MSQKPLDVELHEVKLRYEYGRGAFSFEIKDASYILFFVPGDKNKKHNVIAILHKSGTCPLCLNENEKYIHDNICRGLYREKENVLDYSIMHPSVRLRWLLKKR